VKRMPSARPALFVTAALSSLLLVNAAGMFGQAVPPADPAQTAIALEQEGKTTEAETAWKAAMKLHPRNSDAYAHLGFLEARQEHYIEAVRYYRKALALNPAMPGLRMNLGLALFKAGQLKDAVSTFALLLKTEPAASPDAQRLTTLIGLAHYGLGEYAAAVPYLKKAEAYDPQSLPFRLALAHSCLGAKQFPCVLDVYKEILTLNAESAEADMLAGEAMDAMQDHAGAIQQFRAAVKANPNEPNVHFGLGYLLWTQNQYPEAAQEFQAELVNVPESAQAMAYLADTQIKMSQPDKALPLLQNAIRISPTMELPHLDLGILHADAGQREEALAELHIAAKLSPDDFAVHYRLARLLKSMGRQQEAAVEFEKTNSLHKAASKSVSDQIKSMTASEATKPQ
jgi:tetratricopeptide (TPR) repeat protein